MVDTVINEVLLDRDIGGMEVAGGLSIVEDSIDEEECMRHVMYNLGCELSCMRIWHI